MFQETLETHLNPQLDFKTQSVNYISILHSSLFADTFADE